MILFISEKDLTEKPKTYGDILGLMKIKDHSTYDSFCNADAIIYVEHYQGMVNLTVLKNRTGQAGKKFYLREPNGYFEFTDFLAGQNL